MEIRYDFTGDTRGNKVLIAMIVMHLLLGNYIT